MSVAIPHPSNSVEIHPQTHPEELQDTDPNRSSPEPEDGLDIGIDKLALSLPIVSIRQEPMLWDEVWSNGAMLEEDHQGAHLSIKIRRIQRSLRCKLEINPSRVLDPHGFSLCRAEDAFSAVKWAFDQLAGRADFVPDTDLITIKRLDVARDFHVMDPQFFIAGLVHLHRPYSRNPCLYFDERTGGASTLLLGSSSTGGSHVQLYDRYLRKGEIELRGVLRWEVQARSSWAERYGGIKTLADLTPDRVEQLAWDRWQWSRMGEVVVSKDDFIDRAYQADWPTTAMRDKLIGQYEALLRGKNVFTNSKARDEFNKMQRRLGVSAGLGSGQARRLDFFSGTDEVETR